MATPILSSHEPQTDAGSNVGATSKRYNAFIKLIKELEGLGGADGTEIIFESSADVSGLTAALAAADVPGAVEKDGLRVAKRAAAMFEKYSTEPGLNLDMEDVDGAGALRHWTKVMA